jgi:hypothetical protein
MPNQTREEKPLCPEKPAADPDPKTHPPQFTSTIPILPPHTALKTVPTFKESTYSGTTNADPELQRRTHVPVIPVNDPHLFKYS